MFYTSRRHILQSQSVSFEWSFEDENEEEIIVLIEAVCHPEEPQTRDDLGYQAFVEISARGLTRELTAQEEYDICTEPDNKGVGGKYFSDVKCEAFEKAGEECHSAQDAYDDIKMQEWKESRNRPAAIFEKETEYAY